ncbi:S41 family peptidase [Chitinophaga tropicalis]|uniref:Tail specific protease domain-containing protein n=1 Tax=Chitinophaga tropicalis TaxID=2683588 RepID=A0A7K1UE07_9BACT|nr:S41 family peptidase [Chitinophaga tropicalis]MVT12612.1 hypothetical protein [Chitinophaga tropicalis]
MFAFSLYVRIKSKKRSLFLILFFLFVPGLTTGQHLTAAYYKRDLDTLRKAFEATYPSLYRFNTKASIDKVFDSCSNAINNGTTDYDFYRTVKLILSAVRDGHLGCSPSDTFKKKIEDSDKYFPFSLIFLDNKAFVDCGNKNALPTGTEILSINNENINDIRKHIFNYIVSDGIIETKKYWILSHSFWFYYNLVYGQQTVYQVKYRSDNGQIATIIVDSELRKDTKCQSIIPEWEQAQSLTYPLSNTALLYIPNFTDDGFAGFLDSSFRDIKQKPVLNLIIDLRGNGGGRDVYGSLLYSYLTDKAFKYYASLEKPTVFLTAADHPNLAVQQPNADNFNGNVYILIDGLSFSVTTEFCAIAKDNNRAIFIGEETGGTYCGNTSGGTKEVLLPYSGITLFIPTTKYTMAVTDAKNKDRGIIPDYHVLPTIKDLIQKNDAALNFALRLVKEPWQQKKARP